MHIEIRNLKLAYLYGLIINKNKLKLSYSYIVAVEQEWLHT